MTAFIRSVALCLAAVASLSGCGAPLKNVQAKGAETSPPAVSRAAIAQGLYELAYSEKQGVLFVASAGSFADETVPTQVLVVDPASLSVIGTIKMPMKAFSMALDDAGDRLYIGNTGKGAVTVVDTRTRQILNTFQLVGMVKDEKGRERPEFHFRELMLDPPHHRLYMLGFANRQSTLFIVDTRNGRVEKTIPGFGYTATGIALDAKDSRLYVSNMEGEALVVDTQADKIVDRFRLGGAEQPLNLAYDGKRHRLIAVDQGHPKMRGFQKKDMPGYESKHPGRRVVVIDLASKKLVAEFPAGGPVALKLDDTHGRLYISNRMSGEVTVFDAADYKKLDAISLPDHPNSFALNGKTGDVFVTVKNGEGASKGAPESLARIRY